MNIIILNQFSPPDASPTARLAGELAGVLEEDGHRVRFISCPPGYRKRRRGPLRIFAEAGSWIRLVIRALGAGGNDLWIVFSSPPLVLLVALLASFFRGGKVIHWVLDAYPDLAVRLGAFPQGFIYNTMRSLVRKAYHRCDRVVAVSVSMADWLWRDYQIEATAIYPWPPPVLVNPEPDRTDSGKEHSWMYSGNLGRAHDWQTLLDVQEELEKRKAGWRLVLQGGGAGWELSRNEAVRRGLKEVDFFSYAKAGDLVPSLLQADVRVVTCRPEVAGLLWPSKLALLRALPGPHLWIGPDSPDADLGDGFTRFSNREAVAVADWLQSLTSARPVIQPGRIEESVDRFREEGFTCWRRLVSGP